MDVRNLDYTDIGGSSPEQAAEGFPTRASAALNRTGRAWAQVRADLIRRKCSDYDWRSGRIPLYVYHDNDELLSVSREAYNLYFSENALGGRAFPSLVRMEQELVAMSLALFNAPQGASGSFTSGGTESIFLALKAARDHFVSKAGFKARSNIVIPRTAHPVFDKAASYLGIDVIRTPVGTDLRADPMAVRRSIGPQTMLIAGSAPCYPYGVFDPISALAEVARSEDVWLHVDACLGGFLAPFARDEGYPIPDFDFSIPGVTTLSADFHKYGLSAKGASVILYREPNMHQFQGFRFDSWPRGSYSTNTFLGTRPGGAIASAWAVSQYLGREGYRRLARTIMEAKDRLVRGIAMIPGLEVLRPSDLSIVVYRSTDNAVDINAVAELMGERGWFVGRSREPEGLHFALNAVHAPVIGDYLQDLGLAVTDARATKRVGNRDDMTY
jgi:glutamate/tyrosine decarboxylase-like PLP-dependent enzyme